MRDTVCSIYHAQNSFYLLDEAVEESMVVMLDYAEPQD